MLGSNSCGQINGKVDDISGTVPTAFTTPDPNFQVSVKWQAPVSFQDCRDAFCNT
jgi:hypothetical protein